MFPGGNILGSLSGLFSEVMIRVSGKLPPEPDSMTAEAGGCGSYGRIVAGLIPLNTARTPQMYFA